MFQIVTPQNIAFFSVSNYHKYSLKWGELFVNITFSETLRNLREQSGLSQTQLAKQLFVNRSTVVRWENGSRMPDAAMILFLARALGVDSDTLLSAAAESSEAPNVILVDDSRPILTDGLAVLEEVLPDVAVTGFVSPPEAVEFARSYRVTLAILDIELGTASGLDLCRTLLEINSRTNVVYLTSYPDYALDAWGTGACGFLVKPLTPESVKQQLKKLRYPIV